MTCLAFYYVPDAVFPEAGMWTGMCFALRALRGRKKKNLACCPAPEKRSEVQKGGRAEGGSLDFRVEKNCSGQPTWRSRRVGGGCCAAEAAVGASRLANSVSGFHYSCCDDAGQGDTCITGCWTQGGGGGLP